MLQDLLQIVIPIRSFALSFLIHLSHSCYNSGQSTFSLPQGRGNSHCLTLFAGLLSETGQQPGSWRLVNELDTHQSSVFGKPIFLSLHVKYGWKRLSWSNLLCLSSKCSFLMKTGVEQYLIKFCRTKAWCWVLNLLLLLLSIVILKQDLLWI